MNRTGLYVLIGVLVVLVIGLGIYIYNEQTRPGLDVRVDGQGISIKGNG
jgi:hypothetical protein